MGGSKKNTKLIARNLEIFKLRYVYNWTLQRIGDKYGITRERVRQILNENGGYIEEKRNHI